MIKIIIGATIALIAAGGGVGIIQHTAPAPIADAVSDPFNLQKAAGPMADVVNAITAAQKAAKATPAAAPLTAAQAAASKAAFAAEGQVGVTPVACSGQVSQMSSELVAAGGNELACATN
ncbi:MAG: hypothetical protein JWM49_2034 [Microbacteriaceae bacterium]|nr:hypothetical protein [Microbacteriaceae bacterium]